MKRILLTGGGTAGHVTPNIALIPTLRKHNFEIHYAGTRQGIEFDLISRENVPFHFITAGKLRRYFDLKNITDIFRIVLGLIQSILLIMRLRPDIIFSKGGFVSCPVVWAAWLFGMPVIIHESDITPGLANRISIPFAKRICFSFPETARHLTTNKGIHTGIPIRHSLFEGRSDEGKRICGFDDKKPVIMIIGGSLGSQIVNAMIRESLTILLREFNICHICGKGNLVEDQKGYRQFEYVNKELAHFFAMADIVVSRSGATTLFELLALRKPALLIPLASNASRGDQILNARSFEGQGYSRVLLQENLSSETLITALSAAFNDRKKMIDAMESSSFSDGVEPVVKVIESIVK